MLCPVCQEKQLFGKQKVCSGACRVKQSRQRPQKNSEVPKDAVVFETVEKLSDHTFKQALLLPVDISQPFSKQQEQALKLDKQAAHNTRNGKDEWVVPGTCAAGACLNPNCKIVVQPA